MELIVWNWLDRDSLLQRLLFLLAVKCLVNCLNLMEVIQQYEY